MSIDKHLHLWPQGRNLLRYDRDQCVLTDHQSPVAIGAYEADAMGVQQLYFQGYPPSAERPVMDPMIRFFVWVGSEWQAIPVLERTCWPGGWMESGVIAGWEVVQKVWFCKANQLQVRLEAVPTETATTNQLQFALGGGHTLSPLNLGGRFDDEQSMVLTLDSRAKDSEGEPQLKTKMAVHTSVGIEACGFRHNAAQNSMPVTDGEELVTTVDETDQLGYWLMLPAQSCDENGVVKIDTFVDWGFNGNQVDTGEESQRFDQRIEYWRTLIDQFSLPSNNMYWWRKGAVALTDLLSSLIQAPGYGNMADKIGIGARTLGHLSRSYFWDAMTTVPVIAQINQDWAAEIIENFTQYKTEHDCPPFAISAFPSMKGVKRSWRGSQAPIAGWAVMKHANCTGERTMVKRLYEDLKWINNSWFQHADPDGSGIPVWMNSGATADDSPLYDMYAGSKEWTNIYLPPIASTCLCSYLLMDLKSLGQMATWLELPAEAEQWKKKANALDAKMIDLLWHDDEKIFYDLDLTVYQPTRIKTFFNLLPLWAGVSLSKEDAKAAIEQHLLNPQEMWGDIPFPSVAYNESKYDPKGYWRGMGWPHIYFWNTEILAKYGYQDEANEARHRFLRLLADCVDIPENFLSSTRISDRRAHGHPHYSWGLATALYFLWDWHLQPVEL